MIPEELPLLPGDPEAVGDTAAGLSLAAARFDGVAGALESLVGARWHSPSGERFGERLGAVPGPLRAVARRYAGAAVVLRDYAAALEEAQGAAQRAQWRLDCAGETVDALDRRLAATRDDAARLALETERARWVPELDAARVLWHDARARLDAADARCGARLRALADDGLTDPALYRLLHRVQTVGAGAAAAGLVPTPWTQWAGGVGAASSTAATVALKVCYDEGSWRSIAAQEAVTASLAGARVLRSASAARPAGALTGGLAGRLTVGERLAVGARSQLWTEAPWRLPTKPSTVVRPPLPAPSGSPAERARRLARNAYQRRVVDDWDAATLSGPGGRELLLGAWGVKGAVKGVTTAQKVRDREAQQERVREEHAVRAGASW